MKRTHVGMQRILFLFLALLVAAPLSAQNANNQSQLRLVVVDETGAGIPQATITVTPASGEAVTFASDDRGLGHLAEPALAMALGQRLGVAVANCSGIGHILAAGGSPMVSLYGPTNPGKYAPYASALIALRAQDFGPTGNIEGIPLDAVGEAVDRQLDLPANAR